MANGAPGLEAGEHHADGGGAAKLLGFRTRQARAGARWPRLATLTVAAAPRPSPVTEQGTLVLERFNICRRSR